MRYAEIAARRGATVILRRFSGYPYSFALEGMEEAVQAQVNLVAYRHAT